jgi:hypothetical protein
VTQVVAETIELPDNEGITGAYRFEAGVEAWPIVFLPLAVSL